MENSGVTKSLIDWIDSLVGTIKGSIGAVTVLTTAFFGAISGSNCSAVATIGTIMIPQLEKQGYPREYATALVACAAPIATLIPPSIAMILFSVTGNLSVSACFLATMVPGLLLTLGYIIYNYFIVRNNPNIIVHTKVTFKVRSNNIFRTSKKALPGIIMPSIVLGGIYSGLFSPTEAASVALVYTVIIGLFIYKGLSFKTIYDSIANSASVLGSIMVMLFFIFALGRELILAGFPDSMAKFIIDMAGGNKYAILLFLNITMLIIGMFMDDCSGSVLTAIILLPIATKVGISPIHFAAIAGVNLGLGNITPPCAPLLLMAGSVGNIPLKEYVFHGIKMAMIVHLPLVFLTTYIPSLSLTLPNALGFN